MNMVQVVILGFDLGTIEILQNYELNCSIAPKIQKPFLKKNLFVFSLILVMTNKFFALSWHLSLFLILFYCITQALISFQTQNPFLGKKAFSGKNFVIP